MDRLRKRVAAPGARADEKPEDKKAQIIAAIRNNDPDAFHGILLENDFDLKLLNDEEVKESLELASNEIKQIAQYRQNRPILVEESNFRIITKPQNIIETEFLKLIEYIKNLEKEEKQTAASIDKELFSEIPRKDLLKMIYMLDENGCGIINYILVHNKNKARGLLDLIYTNNKTNYVKDLLCNGIVDSYKLGGDVFLLTLSSSSFTDIYREAMENVLDPAMLTSQYKNSGLLFSLASRFDIQKRDPKSSGSESFTEIYFAALKRFSLEPRESIRFTKGNEYPVLHIAALGCISENFRVILENDKSRRLDIANRDKNPFNAAFHIIRQIGITHKAANDRENINIRSGGEKSNAGSIRNKKEVRDAANKIFILIVTEMKARGKSLLDINTSHPLPYILILLAQLGMKKSIDALIDNHGEACAEIFRQEDSWVCEEKCKELYGTKDGQKISTKDLKKILQNRILFLACKNNIPSLARFVLEQGANPFLKFKDEEKETTLIEYAIKNGASADFLNFLLKNYDKQYDEEFQIKLILELLDKNKGAHAKSLIKGFYKEHPVNFLLEKNLSAKHKSALLQAIIADDVAIKETIEQRNPAALNFILENNPNLDLYRIYDFARDCFGIEVLDLKNDPNEKYFKRIAEIDITEPKILPAFTAQDFLEKTPEKACLSAIFTKIEAKEAKEKAAALAKELKKITERQAAARLKKEAREGANRAKRNEALYEYLLLTHEINLTELKEISAQQESAESKTYSDKKPDSETVSKNPDNETAKHKTAKTPKPGQTKISPNPLASSKRTVRIETEESERIREEEKRRREEIRKKRMQEIQKKVEESARNLKSFEERTKAILALSSQDGNPDQPAAQQDLGANKTPAFVASGAASAQDSEFEGFLKDSDDEAASANSATTPQGEAEEEIPQDHLVYYQGLQVLYNVVTPYQAKKLYELNSLIQNSFEHFLLHYSSIANLTLKGSSLYDIFLPQRKQKTKGNPCDIDLEVDLSLRALNDFGADQEMANIFDPDLSTDQLKILLEKMLGFSLDKDVKIIRYTETKNVISPYVANISLKISLNNREFDITIKNTDGDNEYKIADYNNYKDWVTAYDALRLPIAPPGFISPIDLCKGFVVVAMEEGVYNPRELDGMTTLLGQLGKEESEILCNPFSNKLPKYLDYLIDKPKYPGGLLREEQRPKEQFAPTPAKTKVMAGQSASAELGGA